MGKVAAASMVLCACAHVELLAVDAPEAARAQVTLIVREELDKKHRGLALEDATKVWKTFEGDEGASVPLRFLTFDEAPASDWPKALESEWKETAATCKQRLGPGPYLDLKTRNRATTCSLSANDVLWNRYLAYRGAKGSLAVKWATRGDSVGVEVTRVTTGKEEMCQKHVDVEQSVARDELRKLLRLCLDNPGLEHRLVGTRLPAEPGDAKRDTAPAPAPAPKKEEPPPPPPVLVNGKLDTRSTGNEMPVLELPCPARPGVLYVEGPVAPKFSQLLERRWARAGGAEGEELHCTLEGGTEFQQSANSGVLPLRVNTYAVTCGAKTVTAKAAAEGDFWVERVSRKLLYDLASTFCPAP